MSAAKHVGDLVPWYTGLPRSAREKRLTMALQMYSDESGKNDPPAYVMAGFISRPEAWLSFSEEWQAALDEHPAIPQFKMSEAMGLAGPFFKWKKEDRDSRIVKLADIVKRHVIVGVAVTIPHDAWNNVMRGRLMKDHDDSYMTLFDLIILRAHITTAELGLTEEIDFIFDRQLGKEQLLDATWDTHLAKMDPARAARFTTRPVFMDDKRALPLQAADMLAWHVRRSVADGSMKMATASAAGPILATRFKGNEYWTEEGLVAMRTAIHNEFAKHNTVTPHVHKLLQTDWPTMLTLENFAAMAGAKLGDEIELKHLPAIGTGRFLLVSSCDSVDKPHLHRRSNNACLDTTQD